MSLRAFKCAAAFAFAASVVLNVAEGPMTAQRRPSPTGMFGRLEYRKESGDVDGVEVFVVVGRRGRHVAIVQFAEGGPDDPVVVPVRLQGDGISFDVPVADGSLHYEGTVQADGLHGRFTRDGEPVWEDIKVLKRGSSYWQ